MIKMPNRYIAALNAVRDWSRNPSIRKARVKCSIGGAINSQAAGSNFRFPENYSAGAENRMKKAEVDQSGKKEGGGTVIDIDQCIVWLWFPPMTVFHHSAIDNFLNWCSCGRIQVILRRWESESNRWYKEGVDKRSSEELEAHPLIISYERITHIEAHCRNIHADAFIESKAQAFSAPVNGADRMFWKDNGSLGRKQTSSQKCKILESPCSCKKH